MPPAKIKPRPGRRHKLPGTVLYLDDSDRAALERLAADDARRTGSAANRTATVRRLIREAAGRDGAQ
jgi:hypothetical protein